MSKAVKGKGAATYDFRGAKRGAVLPQHGKTRITIFIDTDTLDAFRAIAERDGRGYQTLMNEALRSAVVDAVPLEERVRSVVREELARLRAS
ncbi:MAG: BrnA antitoxin family protein [Candidatus Eremiobacteraeota bacterium]|nr:BrnA antitoxin family protein [Candidatus Eremiobacteraeota bacterium]